MKASIIIIGDEILLGQVTDTNSGSIARMLAPMGWAINDTRVVADDPMAIRAAVTAAMAESPLVITTGGLGPTKDDITKHVLAEYFGGSLVYDETVAANIERIFDKRGLQLNDSTKSQAMVPSSCRVIQNELGTAPIMWFEQGGHVLISMPGVPFETVGMMQRAVLAEIKRRFNPHDTLSHHTLIVTGLPESALSEHLSEWEEALPAGMHLAYLPVPGYIRLRLDAVNADEHEFDRQVASLKAVLGSLLLHDGDATLAEILLEMLRARRLTVATAESCTGGYIAHCITAVPGASESFMGGVVSYSNEAKSNVLGVCADDIRLYGAVSEPVVRQMACGAARVMGADCAMATSGIAGPGGGTPDKPVGTVWIAVHVSGKTISMCRHLPGDRARVIGRSATEAMLMLIKELKQQ